MHEEGGPKCPNCASDDVALRGSASLGTPPVTHQMWECKVCHTLFAYLLGKKT
jgi:transposase-like protein